jgi:hypothetical protein
VEGEVGDAEVTGVDCKVAESAAVVIGDVSQKLVEVTTALDVAEPPLFRELVGAFRVAVFGSGPPHPLPTGDPCGFGGSAFELHQRQRVFCSKIRQDIGVPFLDACINNQAGRIALSDAAVCSTRCLNEAIC